MSYELKKRNSLGINIYLHNFLAEFNLQLMEYYFQLRIFLIVKCIILIILLMNQNYFDVIQLFDRNSFILLF